MSKENTKLSKLIYWMGYAILWSVYSFIFKPLTDFSGLTNGIVFLVVIVVWSGLIWINVALIDKRNKSEQSTSVFEIESSISDEELE